MKSISLFLKEKINLLALTACGAFIGFWMIVVSRGYYYFIFGQSRDTGYNAQLLWNMLHGSLTSSLINACFIVDHCYFLSFLIAPIYGIWPDPMLLQYLKIIAFFAGAYIFFLIFKKYLHPFIALGAMIAFTLAPANFSMLLGLFNYETFAIPLIFLIFKAMDENNLTLYLISCFFLVLVKEQMPLLVMMFGILALLFKKENKIKWGLLPVTAGLIIFIFEVFILTPYLRRGMPVSVDHYWGHYAQFGKTPHAILLFLLTHPARILKQFVLAQNIQWYNGLFGVGGALAFLSPHILLVAFPLFLKSILSNNPQEHDIFYQGYYLSIFTPFIFLAMWNTLNHIEGRWRLPIHMAALALMLIHALVFIPSRLGFFHVPITNTALIKRRLIDKIPPGTSVLSALRTYDNLANRKTLYPLANYLHGTSLVSEKKFVLPGDTDYLLLDFAGELDLMWHPRKYIPRMTALNFDNRWRLQESIEDMALYVRNPSRQKSNRLIDRSFQPFPVTNAAHQTFDNTINLEAIDFPKKFPRPYRIFPVTMYWQCLKKTKAPYLIFITISSSQGELCYSKRRPLGSTIYPTFCWRKGEYVKESYFYLLPPVPQGNYTITIQIINGITKKKAGEKLFYNFTV